MSFAVTVTRTDLEMAARRDPNWNQTGILTCTFNRACMGTILRALGSEVVPKLTFRPDNFIEAKLSSEDFERILHQIDVDFPESETVTETRNSQGRLTSINGLSVRKRRGQRRRQ